MDVALVAFDGVDTAAEAFGAALDRSGPTSRWHKQVGLVERHQDGHLVLRGTFAGHYVDVDEASHTSEEGAAEGWKRGALAGFLLTPAGFAVGSVLGAVIGSQEGEPSERETAPALLTDKLREALPSPGSGLVVVAEADLVEDMLQALELGDAYVTRRSLSENERADLDIALGSTPA